MITVGGPLTNRNRAALQSHFDDTRGAFVSFPRSMIRARVWAVPNLDCCWAGPGMIRVECNDISDERANQLNTVRIAHSRLKTEAREVTELEVIISTTLDIAGIRQRMVRRVHKYVKCQSTNDDIRGNRSEAAKCNHQSNMEKFDNNLTSQSIRTDMKQPIKRCKRMIVFYKQTQMKERTIVARAKGMTEMDREKGK